MVYPVGSIGVIIQPLLPPFIDGTSFVLGAAVTPDDNRHFNDYDSRKGCHLRNESPLHLLE